MIFVIHFRNAKAAGKTKGKGKGGKRESIKEEEKEEELKHPVDAITVSSVTSEEMKLFRWVSTPRRRIHSLKCHDRGNDVV